MPPIKQLAYDPGLVDAVAPRVAGFEKSIGRKASPEVWDGLIQEEIARRSSTAGQAIETRSVASEPVGYGDRNEVRPYMPGTRAFSDRVNREMEKIPDTIPALMNTPVSENPMYDAGITGMTVYHGSPYKFAKFLKEKIGTGEGAQAYGHGLYFAENPKVAGDYIRAGKNIGFENWDDPIRMADKAYAQAKGDKASAMKILDDEIAKTKGDSKRNNLHFAKKALERGDHSASLYHVDLPDEKIGKMLDWDKKLSEQDPSVQKIVRSMFAEDVWENMGKDPRGREIYKWLTHDGSDIEASEMLLEYGIPGIKYLDGGSRGGKGVTRNFVVFNPDDVKILERK